MSAPNKERPVVQPAWLTADGGSEAAGSSSSAQASISAASSAPAAGASKGPLFKPKFAPKLPVKKEVSTSNIAPSGAPASEGTTVPTARPESTRNGDKHGRKNGNPLVINKFTPRNKSVGFKDGPAGGNRKWVMPVGAAFFTGTNKAGSSSSAPTASSTAAIPHSGSNGSLKGPVALGSPSGQGRIMRPNEQIDQVQRRIPKSSSNVSFTAYQAPVEPDSDAENDDGQDEDDLALVNNEVWPPNEYDPLAPLALPLGPRTQGMRNQLAAEPILADPIDHSAMAKEETSSLFVLQLPTDLKFEKLKERVPEGEDGSRIHIGKMQLLKSGRVRLIGLDGKTYEVNSGMASSFVQILSTVQVPEDTSKSAAAAALDAATGNASSSAATANSAGAGRGVGRSNVPVAPKQPEVPGTMHLMGSVTKKLVLTPAYDIGVRRTRAYSTSATASGQKISPELLSLFGQQPGAGKGAMFPEDEVIVGDV